MSPAHDPMVGSQCAEAAENGAGRVKGAAYSLKRLGTSILKYEAFKDQESVHR